LILGVFQLSFLNSAYGASVRNIHGWIFICIWMSLLISNIFFIAYSSFVLNYTFVQAYIISRRKQQAYEDAIRYEMNYKNSFLEENKDNFMVKFEVLNAEQYLNYRASEDSFFNAKRWERKEIEWLKANKFSEKEI